MGSDAEALPSCAQQQNTAIDLESAAQETRLLVEHSLRLLYVERVTRVPEA